MSGVLLALAVAVAAPTAPAFDPQHPPAAIGESLAQVLARWGERAIFGADCGSWRGASVDLDLAWQGRPLRVMALLQGDRVAALRFERTRDDAASFAQCEVQLSDFQAAWSATGIEAGERRATVYDGPVLRAVHAANRQRRSIGTFEGDYRASRTVCKAALVITQP